MYYISCENLDGDTILYGHYATLTSEEAIKQFIMDYYQDGFVDENDLPLTIDIYDVAEKVTKTIESINIETTYQVSYEVSKTKIIKE